MDVILTDLNFEQVYLLWRGSGRMCGRSWPTIHAHRGRDEAPITNVQTLSCSRINPAPRHQPELRS